MKSKRRLLLTALLMVVMAVLLTVPALANPKLNKNKLTLRVGQKTRLKVKGTKDKVTWDSSNLEVVYVDDTGKIWADKPGKVTITAKVGGKKLKCKVTVKAKKPKPTPTPTPTPTPIPTPTPTVNISFPALPYVHTISRIYETVSYTIEKMEYKNNTLFITAVKSFDESQVPGRTFINYFYCKIINADNIVVVSRNFYDQNAAVGERFQTSLPITLAPGDYRFEFTQN